MIKKTVWSDDSTNTSSHLAQKRLPTRTLGMLRNKEARTWRNLIFKPRGHMTRPSTIPMSIIRCERASLAANRICVCLATYGTSSSICADYQPTGGLSCGPQLLWPVLRLCLDVGAPDHHTIGRRTLDVSDFQPAGRLGSDLTTIRKRQEYPSG